MTVNSKWVDRLLREADLAFAVILACGQILFGEYYDWSALRPPRLITLVWFLFLLIGNWLAAKVAISLLLWWTGKRD
jgi:hypothetical protein